MPEVITPVDKDDSLEKLKQECERYGTVNYMSKVNAALREGKSVGEAMQIAHFEIERARLEREVMKAVRQALQAQREFGHVCVDVEPIFTAQEELERFEQTNVLEHKGS